MKIVATLGALAIGATAFIVYAGDPASPGGPGGPGGLRGAHMMERIKAADTNGDGMLSRAEAAVLPRIAEHFDEIDANKDGQITFEELRAFHEKQRMAQREAHWKHIDTDGDGRISRAEAQANAPRLFEHFDELDVNKDGYLTKDEIKGGHGRRS